MRLGSGYVMLMLEVSMTSALVVLIACSMFALKEKMAQSDIFDFIMALSESYT